MGAYQMLNQSHLLVDVVFDSQLDQEQLNSYRALVLSNSADVGSGYLHNPHPVLKRFVADLAARARLSLELEAPRAIEVTAFLPKSDHLYIHLLNNPTPNLPLSLTRQRLRSFFYLEEVLPVHDVRIRFNDFKPAFSAYAYRWTDPGRSRGTQSGFPEWICTR